MTPLERARAAFLRGFGREASLAVQAPGRVNLIGEHTDYNGGFVLPCAIDFHTVVCGLARSDGLIRVLAVDHEGEHDEFSLTQAIEATSTPEWANYVRGSVAAMVGAGHRVSGADIAITGNVPQGAGLSSSASLVVAVGQFFSVLSGLSLAATDIALFGQSAENKYVGAQTGVMDQLISAKGEVGHALLIDCRSLEFHPVGMPEDLAIVIVDSQVQRGLVGSEYNTRRQQCESAARHFGVRALRDLAMDTLEARARELDPVIFRRARHIISDSRRAVDLSAALRHGDRHAIGELMQASHRSMRDDFEITVPAIDALVDIVKDVIGDRGGVRMTGGGFGGCVVSLMPHELVSPVREAVARHYKAASGLEARIYLCQARAGAGICV